MSDERDLVRRCLAREERAYRELIRQYQTPVVNLAWRITGNAEDAAEVGQETFVRVLRSLHTYDPERPLKTWLFKIAANLALDVIRRRKRRPVSIQDLFDEDEGPLLEAVEPGSRWSDSMSWSGKCPSTTRRFCSSAIARTWPTRRSQTPSASRSGR